MSLQQFDDESDGALVHVISSGTALEAQVRGEIDIQISTAKRFGRDIGRSLKNAVALATMSAEIGKSCIYTVPRGRDGNVTGKSIRLAEIAMNCWGNMRAQTLVVGMDEEFVTVEGRAFDLESNVAISQQVRRRIVDRNGKRYSTDVLTSTTNAASSIALRNAIFRVIPGPFTDQIYEAARKAGIGDIQTFPERRDKAINAFLKMGIREKQIFDALGVVDRQSITGDEYLMLEGFMNAIKQEGVSVESIFPAPQQEAASPTKGVAATKEKLNAQKAAKQETPVTEAPTEPAQDIPAETRWNTIYRQSGLEQSAAARFKVMCDLLERPVSAHSRLDDSDYERCIAGLGPYIQDLKVREAASEKAEDHGRPDGTLGLDVPSSTMPGAFDD